MSWKNKYFQNILGDLAGGTSGILVSFPSTIAYGLICFAPLGPQYASMAVMGAILGTVPLCFIASFMGGIKTMISAPTAASAAVISVFVSELVKDGHILKDDIPLMVTLLCMYCGLLQILIGMFGGGKFIKYIPISVITGYLSGLCVLILIGQLPKLFGLPKGCNLIAGLASPGMWNWECMVIGGTTILVMFIARKFIKKVPAVMVAMFAGVATYWVIALFEPALQTLDSNPYVIGKISASPGDLFQMVTGRWAMFPHFNTGMLKWVFLPGIEITLLVSITTLNSCLVIDTVTYSNHSPRRELSLQGLGNIAAGLFCGIPGAGSLTTTFENLRSGGKTRVSLFFAGVVSIVALLFFMHLFSWIPLPVLAGILTVVAISLIDFKVFGLLKYKSTVFDFFVILIVVIAAAELDLIKAAGVGICMAIILFLKEQMGANVIRRKLFGNQIFSKKVRHAHEHEVLDKMGKDTIIIQLHGPLFFGTTDQLYSKLEPYFSTCKYFVLDMQRIQSLDYTAANMLSKIVSRITEQKGFLIFCAMPDALYTGLNPKKYLENFGLFKNEGSKSFHDLDAALTWIEDKILADESIVSIADKVMELRELNFFNGFSESAIHEITSCIDAHTYHDNEPVFKKGNTGDEIYFVRGGNIKIVLPMKDHKQFHLQTICSGGVFGEMSFIDNVSRSADAYSEGNSHLYVLSRKKFDEITKLHPEVGGLFFERLAFIVAHRLRQSNKELMVLYEN